MLLDSLGDRRYVMNNSTALTALTALTVLTIDLQILMYESDCSVDTTLATFFAAVV